MEAVKGENFALYSHSLALVLSVVKISWYADETLEADQVFCAYYSSYPSVSGLSSKCPSYLSGPKECEARILERPSAPILSSPPIKILFPSPPLCAPVFRGEEGGDKRQAISSGATLLLECLPP